MTLSYGPNLLDRPIASAENLNPHGMSVSRLKQPGSMVSK